MYQKRYQFENTTAKSSALPKELLYHPENECGFVTEQNREVFDCLQIAELNSAFEPWFWDKGKELSHLLLTTDGVQISDPTPIPLIFKANVSHQGNYRVTLTISGGEEGVHDLMIFIGRRRLAERGISISKGEKKSFSYAVNVCDIIPRGKEEIYEDKSIDIALVVPAPLKMGTNVTIQPSPSDPICGGQPILCSVFLEEIHVPTIYIAGDSTVTDQSGTYPYDPGCCYCGWAQVFPLYVKEKAAVSNHAHSGLTSESFREEGHYAIIQRYIKPGDFFLMQFGHNDQKLSHLSAKTGYAENLRRYIKEIREKQATPILVTPLSRNTWAPDSSSKTIYNDLLKDWAEACFEIGNELSVPVIDLHADSMNFIKERGVLASSSYFYPKDYTHLNDYGAYVMAGFVAEQIKKSSIPILSEFMQEGNGIWTAPSPIHLPTPPTGYTVEGSSSLPVLDEWERSDDRITRAEALDLVIKAVHFVPMNVYNDSYPDVIGHEWYAGTVECALQNHLVDAALTSDGFFHPMEPVTGAHLLSFCVNACLSRHPLTSSARSFEEPDSEWFTHYLSEASELKLPKYTYPLNEPLTRKHALLYIKEFEKIL